MAPAPPWSRSQLAFVPGNDQIEEARSDGAGYWSLRGPWQNREVSYGTHVRGGGGGHGDKGAVDSQRTRHTDQPSKVERTKRSERS